jgi:hypothetical protein
MIQSLSLHAHDRRITSPFGLLGTDENALSFALGYTFQQCPPLLIWFLKQIGIAGVSTPLLPSIRIDLQRHRHGDSAEGITDIEIRLPGHFHIIAEAKVGLGVPSIEQCRKYLSRLISLSELGVEPIRHCPFIRSTSMNKSIFSTYSTGENRVTASILAVLRSLALPRIERILGALMEDDNFELVRFQNQVKGEKSTPDGEIFASTRLLIETKLVRNGLTQKQLEGHLNQLNSAYERVLALTPDDVTPEIIAKIDDPRLVWNSFAALNQALDELLTDEREVVSEREEFLLRELQKMLLAEGLVGSSKEVLVIPAREAWDFYKRHHVYSCPSGRVFQPAKYIAFYAGNKIHPLVPQIVDEPADPVTLERNKYQGRLGDVVNEILDRFASDTLPAGWDLKPGKHVKLFLLSAPNASETIDLGHPIINNLTSESGQRVAFTQNRRYVSLNSLKKAKSTKDLMGE